MWGKWFESQEQRIENHYLEKAMKNSILLCKECILAPNYKERYSCSKFLNIHTRNRVDTSQLRCIRFDLDKGYEDFVIYNQLINDIYEKFYEHTLHIENETLQDNIKTADDFDKFSSNDKVIKFQLDKFEKNSQLNSLQKDKLHDEDDKVEITQEAERYVSNKSLTKFNIFCFNKRLSKIKSKMELLEEKNIHFERGSMGKVCAVKLKDTGKVYALKRIWAPGKNF